MTLEAACCGTLQHIDMPSFKPSSSQVTAASSPSTKPPVKEVHKDSSEAGGGDAKDLVAGMSTLSLALSLGGLCFCCKLVVLLLLAFYVFTLCAR